MNHQDWTADAEAERVEYRRTCVHEAGHAAVARFYGLDAHWFMYPNPTTEPHCQKLWGGLTTTYTQRHSRKAERAIALAGVIATALDEDPFVRDWQLMEALEFGDIPLSADDAAMAAGFTLKDVGNSLFLVSRLMPQILREVSNYSLVT